LDPPPHELELGDGRPRRHERRRRGEELLEPAVGARAHEPQVGGRRLPHLAPTLGDEGEGPVRAAGGRRGVVRAHPPVRGRVVVHADAWLSKIRVWVLEWPRECSSDFARVTGGRWLGKKKTTTAPRPCDSGEWGTAPRRRGRVLGGGPEEISMCQCVW
jgi:hypothetical protein